MSHAALDDIRLLVRYKAWANDVFLSALGTVPPACLTEPHPIVFGSLIRTLNHSCSMDHVWKCHLLDRPHGLTSRNPEHCPGLEELSANQRRIDQWYVQQADAMPTSQLGEAVHFEFIGGGAGRMTRGEIILHVVNHATYHRGHAAGLMYGMGLKPPTTDLPVFLRHHEGAR